MTVASRARSTACSIREAEPRDNDALRAIAAACPMRGDITLCMTREPDFFALNRLEGRDPRVAVAEVDGTVVGCTMVAERGCYLHGKPARTLYAGDLKVHPAWRGYGVANELSAWVGDTGNELAGASTPLMLTILAGNRAMEQRVRATDRTPELRAFARIRAFSIPLLWRRRVPRAGGVHIEHATHGDLEEMAALWSRVAPGRQFAPIMSAESLLAWIARAPGLDISDYRVARRRDGRVAGFLAWWNQSSFKQTRVVRYSHRLRAARTVINAVAAVTGASPLPPEGGDLDHRTALHICVPQESPDVFRALLLSAFGDVRDEGCALVNVGLDVRDPLCTAITGLLAQPTDIGAYVCTPRSDYTGAPLGDRPLHYDIALV